MLWIKSLHIVFVASWFAGLFYLPRIFVNLAMVSPGSLAERERLLLMARKLLRFTTVIAVPAVGLGVWLWVAADRPTTPGIIELGPTARRVLGAVFMLYGLVRFVRGYHTYFRKKTPSSDDE